MWDVGLQIAFAGPYVTKQKYTQYQQLGSVQNAHLKIDKLVEFLTDWSSNETSVFKRAEQLYIDLYERDYIEFADVHLIQLWFQELCEYDYIFPRVTSKFTLAVRTFSGHLYKMNQM